MKSGIFIICICLITFSCEKKDNTAHKTWHYIIAGDTSSDGVIYSGIQDTTVYIMTLSDFSEGGNCKLDVNHDKVMDFNFGVLLESSPGGKDYSSEVTAMNNSFIVVEDDSTYYPDVFETGDTINKTLNFQQSGYTLSSYNRFGSIEDSEGLWNNVSDRYLGFMITEPEDTLYGWIKLTVKDYTSLTIESFAYRK